MKELNDDELDKVSGGIGNSNDENSNKEKWAKVGIKIVEVKLIISAVMYINGCSDVPNAIATCVSTRSLSPKKALEIYTANGGEL